MQGLEQEIAQLKAGMAALEGQRSVLGDAVIDAALGPMREKLAALEAQAQPAQQRKLATILFMDIAGHTILIRDLDPEENMALIDAALARLAEPIARAGGHIARYQGDGFKAVFGLPAAHEDDPENAVRAALAIQDVARAIAADWQTERGVAGFRVRVGIDTGPVFAGGLTEGEDTVKGMPVNLAARLESAATPGTILISHNVYRHIRGVFDVQPQEPITVKGVEEPILTYVVQRAKPRAFRLATRGVEGIETRMIGRDHELGMLREAYTDALAARETQVVTVVADAGVGKSRLLYEFNNWLELRPETIRYFKGRATPNTQHVPYSLFRDLFAFRFDILDSDPAGVALDKFRAGMAEVLEPEQADVVGHWLGFDFSASEAVAALFGGADFGAVARAHLTRYFRELAEARPVVVFLEDIHWADDSSLDLATHLAETLPETHLLGVAITRPSLFERRPHWGEGQRAFKRINLTPLSRRASQELVDEILRLVDDIPESLRSLIVNTAEGNPFYVEEMIKMLIDQGVIVRPGAGTFPAGDSVASAIPAGGLEGSPRTGDRWQVRVERLEGLKVPPTLTGLLQARLDGLPPPEREALQRAAVVGRLFWDDVVAELLRGRRAEVDATLEAIRDRELIFRRERSAFSDANEYIFKHALLRDVAYDTVLMRYRGEFHGRVARWLEVNAGERIGEYLGLIAEHFVQAGELDRAADYQHQFGLQALRTSAFRAARAAFERALALREQSHAAPATSLAHYLKLGEACARLSDFAAATTALERALALARESNDFQTEAEVLSWLAAVASSVGRVAEVDELLGEALPLARRAGGTTLVSVLISLSTRNWQKGDLEAAEAYAGEARDLARGLREIPLEIGATRALGVVAGMRREFETSIRHFETCIALAQQIGDRSQEAKSQSNLGATKQYAGDFAGAVVHYRASFEADQELGTRESMAVNAHNLADVYSALGQLDESRRFALECIRLARQVGTVPLQLAALVPLAEVLNKEGRQQQSLALLGLARSHPSTPNQKQLGINEVLASIPMGPAEIEAGLAEGAALDLEAVSDEILAGKW